MRVADSWLQVIHDNISADTVSGYWQKSLDGYISRQQVKMYILRAFIYKYGTRANIIQTRLTWDFCGYLIMIRIAFHETCALNTYHKTSSMINLVVNHLHFMRLTCWMLVINQVAALQVRLCRHAAGVGYCQECRLSLVKTQGSPPHCGAG
jgi:hypothetical protein